MESELSGVEAVAAGVWEYFPDGLLAIDHAGIIQSLNSQGEIVTGRRREDVVGKRVHDALPLHDRDGANWWDLTDPWGGLRIRTGHRERLLYLPDGREVLATARYLRPGRNQPVEVVVVGLRDAELRRRAEIAQAALISTISHELRSPLGGIKGFSTTLLRQWDQFSDDQRRQMIAAIEEDADRVQRLITDLLDVSRVDAGRLTLRPIAIDVEPFLSRHAARVRATVESLPERDICVKQDPAAATVWADPDRLDQILGNLVENAIRHGAGTITLAAAPAPDADAVDITVCDEGEGIEEQYRGIAFTRFWHQGRHSGSSGLGLHLVQGLAQAHGGTATVHTAPGGGAMLRVRLPNAPAEA